jgi:hypothetical protein
MLLFCMATMAQSSMTDDQVIKFVIKEQKAGTSQQEIAVKLMEHGVTPEQIKRVQKKAERLQKEQGLGAVAGKNADDESQGRRRRNNGQDKTSQKIKDEKKSRRLLTADEVEKRDEEDARQIRGQLDEFMPDSFDIYDREVIRKYLNAKDEYEKNSKKKIFGHSLFQNEELTFEPAMNLATPQNYVLGPGDVLFIDVYGA